MTRCLTCWTLFLSAYLRGCICFGLCLRVRFLPGCEAGLEKSGMRLGALTRIQKTATTGNDIFFKTKLPKTRMLLC